MKLYEIMNHVLATIDAQDSVAQARAKMHQYRSHHLVVMRGMEVAGSLSRDDLKRAHSSPVGDLLAPLREWMAAVVVASPTATVDEATALIAGRAVGGVVVRHDGAVIGFVPRERLADAGHIQHSARHIQHSARRHIGD
jgi:CBS domain-containing protein